MKKQILSVVTTLTLILSMSIIGFAGLTFRVSADVPFNFMVGNKEFKAGKYTVGQSSESSTSTTLIIRSKDNNDMANFNVNNVYGKGKPQAKLIFHRYGNQYFLSQVFDGESEQGSALVKSTAEREAAKKRDVITQNAGEPEVVTVSALIER